RLRSKSTFRMQRCPRWSWLVWPRPPSKRARTGSSVRSSITGETRPIKGVLAMALQAVAEKRTGLLVPTANAQEAAVVEGLNVYPIGSLAEAVGFLSGQVEMDPASV